MIPGVVLVVVLMAAGAAMLIRLMVVLMGRYGGEPISDMRENATFIAQTHRVPRAWRDRARRRYPSLRSVPDDEGQAEVRADRREADARRARRHAILRLERLIRHFSRTSLVVDEAERDELVGSLRKVREEWRESKWDEIVS